MFYRDSGLLTTYLEEVPTQVMMALFKQVTFCKVKSMVKEQRSQIFIPMLAGFSSELSKVMVSIIKTMDQAMMVIGSIIKYMVKVLQNGIMVESILETGNMVILMVKALMIILMEDNT